MIRAKAPLRISFSGGGTDVAPYPETVGGVVLSATIDKYAYGTLKPRTDTTLSVQSLDYDIVAKYRIDEPLPYDGELDLIKAVVNRLQIRDGCDLFIHADAPPGTGLGSSSTVAVTVLGLFKHWSNLPLTDYALADLACKIERGDLGILGGLQDQYTATFGGFNLIEFYAHRVIVNPLRIKRSILNELEYNLMLCYTGKARRSLNLIQDHINYMEKERPETMNAMKALNRLTIRMKDALLTGDLREFGRLLHETGENKKRMNPGVTDEGIDELYRIARKHGAIGGKILGAGGGGYLLLYCDFDKKHIVAEKLDEAGGQVIPFGFDYRGLQTWTVQ